MSGLVVIIGLCYIPPDMSWRVQASKENTHRFAEFCVRDGKQIIAFTNGFIAEDNHSVLTLNQINSDVNGSGIGTMLLLSMVVWANKQGAVELGGDFRPTGDRERISGWYLNRGIQVVNGGYDLQGYIPQVIIACTTRLAVFK